MQRFLFFALLLLAIGVCRGKIQSDLQLENERFSVDERAKAGLFWRGRNTGEQTYESVFIVVDAYAGDSKEFTIETSADLTQGKKLGPGESTSFPKSSRTAASNPTVTKSCVCMDLNKAFSTSFSHCSSFHFASLRGARDKFTNHP